MPTIIYKRADFKFDAPDLGTPLDMSQLKSLADRAGSHYFDAGTMRFFRSRIGATVYTRPEGWYFVTSEQFVGSQGARPRRYSVRLATYRRDPDPTYRTDAGPVDGVLTFTIDTVGEFQGYPDGRAAARAIPGQRQAWESRQ